MSDDDLLYMSAYAASRRYRDKSLSPVELLDCLIRRYETIANTVNPFADCYFEEVRIKAKKNQKHCSCK